MVPWWAELCQLGLGRRFSSNTQGATSSTVLSPEECGAVTLNGMWVLGNSRQEETPGK